MKTYKIFLLIWGLSYSGSLEAQTIQTPTFSKSLSNLGISSLNVETIGGDVNVTGVPDNEARLEVYAKSKSGIVNKDEMTKMLNSQYTLAITTENKKLVISLTKRTIEQAAHSTLSISFKIYVPVTVACDIHDTGGNISISNLAGSQNLVSSGADLRAENVIGTINGTTSGGNISISDCTTQMKLTTSGGSIIANRCHGNIDLNTSGGTISFSKLTGTISVGTSHGNIMGDDIEGELKAITSGGSISLSKLSCSVLAGTSGGNISAEVVDVKKNLRFVVGGGNINLELPKNIQASLDFTANKVFARNLDNFIGSKTSEKIKGSINNGTIEIFAQANNGSVNVKLF